MKWQEPTAGEPLTSEQCHSHSNSPHQQSHRSDNPEPALRGRMKSKQRLRLERVVMLPALPPPPLPPSSWTLRRTASNYGRWGRLPAPGCDCAAAPPDPALRPNGRTRVTAAEGSPGTGISNNQAPYSSPGLAALSSIALGAGCVLLGTCFTQIMSHTEGQADASERNRTDFPGFIDGG